MSLRKTDAGQDNSVCAAAARKAEGKKQDFAEGQTLLPRLQIR
jgi:hypothetical protein